METKKLVEISLLVENLVKNGTQMIREKLGVNSLREFIEKVAKEKGVSVDQAKQIILGDEDLRRIAFAVA